MATVLMVIINAQYHTSLGNLHYEVIPTSIEGCVNTTITTYVFPHSPIIHLKYALQISLIQSASFLFHLLFHQQHADRCKNDR